MPFTREEMLSINGAMVDAIGCDLPSEARDELKAFCRPGIERIAAGLSPFPERTADELADFFKAALDYYRLG